MILGPIESYGYVLHSAKPHLTGSFTCNQVADRFIEKPVATGVMGHSGPVQGGPVVVAMPGNFPRTSWGPVASF